MKKIEIDRTAPVQSNFLGVNAVYHGYAGLPDDSGRVYTPEQCELEADRIKSLGVKIVRTYYKWYAWTRKDGWNWENETMQAFYKWCERMKKRGIEIALHAGWNSPEDITGHGWGGDCPFSDGGVSFEQACENFAAWVSESLHQLVELRGFTNVKYLMLFTESSRSGEPIPGYNAFTVWEKAARTIHERLVKDGRRDLVKLVGPNENARMCNGPKMLKYAAEQAADFLDSFSAHYYARWNMENKSCVRTGNRAVVFQKPGFRFGQLVQLKKQTNYHLSAWVHVICNDYLHLSGNILLGAFEADEQCIKSGNASRFWAGGEPTNRLNLTSVTMADPAPYGDNWFKMELTFNSETATECIIGLFNDVKGDAVTYADDFELLEQGGSTNLLKNPSFEKEDSEWWGCVASMISYDAFYDWKLWIESMNRLLPNGKGLWMDEYNDLFRFSEHYTDKLHGTRLVMGNIGMLNGGAESTLLWTAFDQQWPNNHTNNGDSFEDGNHRCGLMPVLTQSLVPYPDYYAFNLLARYIGGEGTAIYPEMKGQERIHAVLSVQSDGNLTLAVASLAEQDEKICLDLGAACSKPLYRHQYNPKTILPSETAAVIAADKTYPAETKEITVTVPAGGVIVFTTLQD